MTDGFRASGASTVPDRVTDAILAAGRATMPEPANDQPAEPPVTSCSPMIEATVRADDEPPSAEGADDPMTTDRRYFAPGRRIRRFWQALL